MSTVIDYRRKIYAIRDLPTLPIIAQKILTLADDDTAGAEKLAKIISSDQSLAVKVLSLANSAYYGYRSQIATIKHAVVVIGTDMLRQISLSVLIFKTIGRSGKDRVTFWRHSLMAANAAAFLGKRIGISDSDVCFMGGLLHDVGRLVLDANLPTEYAEVRTIVNRDKCGYVEAEQQVFQTDHVEVGAWMAERWQLPQELISAIRLHHTAERPDAPNIKLAAAVFASNIIASAVSDMPVEPKTPPAVELPDAIREALGISQAGLNEVLAELQRKRRQIEQILL